MAGDTATLIGGLGAVAFGLFSIVKPRLSARITRFGETVLTGPDGKPTALAVVVARVTGVVTLGIGVAVLYGQLG